MNRSDSTMRLQLIDFYKLLVRPTVIISTISRNGVSNAAPFSWNAPMATSPRPLFGFSTDVEHDTWRNIQRIKEFVVNLVGYEFGPLMEIMEKDIPYEVSEIQECGLTEVKAKVVKPPRILEAFGWIECRMIDSVILSNHSVWVIGEVVNVEIKDECFRDVVDVEKVKPLNHIWGETFVTDMKPCKYRRA